MDDRHPFRVSVAIAVLIFVYPLLGVAMPANEPIRIAFPVPLTGAQAELGQRMLKAAELSVTILNEAGGMLGRPLILESHDDACDEAQAHEVANRLDSGRADVVIGHCPEIAPKVATDYHRKQMLFIAPAVSSVTFPRHYGSTTFRLGLFEGRLAEKVVDVIRQRGFGTRVAIVGDTTGLSLTTSAVLRDRLKDQGLYFVYEQNVRDSLDIIGLDTVIGQPEVDVLVFVGNDPRILTELQRRGLSARHLIVFGWPFASDLAWAEMWMATREAFQETLVIAPVPKAAVGQAQLSPLAREFLRLLESQGEEPDLAQLYVLASFELWAQAVQSAQTVDPQKIQHELRIRSRPTVFGALRSGESGEIREIRVVEYEAWRGWRPGRVITIGKEGAVSQQLMLAVPSLALAGEVSERAAAKRRRSLAAVRAKGVEAQSKILSGMSRADELQESRSRISARKGGGPPAVLSRTDDRMAAFAMPLMETIELESQSLASLQLATEAPTKTVYNIEVEPKRSAKPLVLEPDKETQLHFHIGPPVAESVVSGLDASQSLEQLAGGKPLTLTVTLDCLVCLTDTHQQGQIQYDPDTRRSTVVTFTITPKHQAVAATNGLGSLILIVDADGIDLDVIQLQAIVGTPTAKALANYSEPAKRLFGAPNVSEIQVPDLVIDIAPGGGGKLPIVIRPILPDLRQHMENQLKPSPRQSWTFESGLSKSDLGGLVFDAYKTFRTLVEQNNTDLKRVYEKLGGEAELSAGAAQLHFSDSDYQRLLKGLRSEGARLYKRLFNRGEPNLRKAMAAIDSFQSSSAQPLRVRIRTADIYAPWQILYPSTQGDIDPNKFWGFRYALGTLQKVDAAQARLRSVMPMPSGDDVVFAMWHGADGEDDVSQRAKLLLQHLGDQLSSGPTAVRSRAEFIKRLQLHAQDIKIIFAYGHASSGTVITPAAGTVLPQISKDWVGSRFLFADYDYLIPRHLDEIVPDNIFADELNPVFLKSQPIVILNACETGTAGMSSTNNNGFVAALTRLGSRAVFVTEAPVWNNFAYHFGKQLVDQLLAGEEAQMALYKVRRKHLKEWKNPLGLLYSLYGNPAARIQRE